MKKYFIVFNEKGKYAVDRDIDDNIRLFDTVDEVKDEIATLKEDEEDLFGDVLTKYGYYEIDFDKVTYVEDEPLKTTIKDGVVSFEVPEGENLEEVLKVMHLMVNIFSHAFHKKFSTNMESKNGVTVVSIDVSDYTTDEKEATQLIMDFIDVYKEELYK